jgi:long-subunit acyl-CoA synthetase (AMP-forming)
VGNEVRRIAAYIQSLNLPPKSNIALLGRNSAHWIMADLAIWMSGHVTVPLYPTLNGETAELSKQNFKNSNAVIHNQINPLVDLDEFVDDLDGDDFYS